MRPLPKDPRDFQARAFDALMADILDRNSKGFDRLDAMRAVSKSRNGASA